MKQNRDLSNNKCEYNGLFHISDWFHVFMDLVKIKENYEPDSDHSELRIWDNIKCQCGGCKGSSDSKSKSKSRSRSKSKFKPKGKYSGNTCDAKYRPRDEIITMRLCGDPEGSLEDKFFYSTYIRKGDYKLLVKTCLFLEVKVKKKTRKLT